MAKVDMILQMVATLMANGLKTKSMERVFCILKMESQNMMESGGMIYTTDGAHSIHRLEVGTNMKVNLEME